jgi:hypothetical protein
LKSTLLKAFKAKLRDQHTTDSFSTPEDLAEKRKRDFARRFSPKRAEMEAGDEDEQIFLRSSEILNQFRITPRRFNGHQVRLQVTFYGQPFPASRDLCNKFNLEYGDTIGVWTHIVKPNDKQMNEGLNQLYATGAKGGVLRTLWAQKKADIYAQLQFSPEDVKSIRAEFFGRTYFPGDEPPDSPYEVRSTRGKGDSALLKVGLTTKFPRGPFRE